jgi:Uri superfamily endonuclease
MRGGAVQTEPMLVSMSLWPHERTIEFRWTIDYLDGQSDVTSQVFSREQIEQLAGSLGQWLASVPR